MELQYREPVFCFTSDIDWAPEWAIETLWERFDGLSVPLTPFVTHQSAFLKQRLSSDDRVGVGLHPNFLPGSTHGSTPEAAVDHLFDIWPDASTFRSHSFVDSTPITDLFAARGLHYDSNLCLFLQPGCVPLRHNSGMWRFPVFWEDDIHYKRGLAFEFNLLRSHLETPGLKIFNIHPLLYSLNVPGNDFYNSIRAQLEEPSARPHSHPGRGVRTLVDELLDWLAGKDYRVCSLHTLYQEASESRSSDGGAVSRTAGPGRVVSAEGTKEALEKYRQATREEKAEQVRSIYDARNVEETYATSRDTNLREIEISFITRKVFAALSSLPETADILDIGCGNGYTLLSLAKKMCANFVGLDFSAKMIQGAHTLRTRMKDQLKCLPEFREADIRALPYDDNSVDVVLSERCLQNLPSRDDQYATLDEVSRVLRPGGRYLMVEGTEDGLERLNELRLKVGLEAIPSVAPDNVSALKFREAELENELEKRFEIADRQYFGTYYLISRVVHPLLVYPDSPRFEARINNVARQIAEHLPDVDRLGHVMGYELVARRQATII
ncbi:MAG: methyltransferase domain-containing protein [Candidatus Zixiibacteriota bacterium]|nr:MAG: methyltransferase domain-containing protein [candidate division Zixibacteria bacterium]